MYRPKKKICDIATPSDLKELKKAYKFVLDDDQDGTLEQHQENQQDDSKKAPAASSSTWQERMVEKYHNQLYKSHVIADLTHYQLGRIGLRWRTKAEVQNGKGVITCGNKHCPCYYHRDGTTKKSIEEVMLWKNSSETKEIESNQLNSYREKSHSDVKREDKDENEYELREISNLKSTIEYGMGLNDYEVHFAYREHNIPKEELVNLNLCRRCAPKIFFKKKTYPFLAARKAREESNLELAKTDTTKTDSNQELDGKEREYARNHELTLSLSNQESNSRKRKVREDN